jgi:hypothetical protein
VVWKIEGLNAEICFSRLFQKVGDRDGKLDIGILSFRGWLRNQHFSPHHHLSINLAEQFGYQEKQKK